MSARIDLYNYADDAHLGGEYLDELLNRVEQEAAASPRAELADRAAENRELRREAGRAADLIDAGETAQAVSLLRYISRAATNPTGE